MSISSRDFCISRRRVGLTFAQGILLKIIHRDLKHLIFHRISYGNRQTNPASGNTKILTCNRHNFLTYEPILVNLKIKSIANIDSESIAGVLSSGNHKQKTFLQKVYFGNYVYFCITSTYFIGIQDQIREEAHVAQYPMCFTYRPDF